MVLAKGYFEELHFPESNINGFEILDNDVIIDIHSGLEVYPPHPLANSHTMSDPCRLIFKNVVSFRRTLSVLAGNSQGFKEHQTVIDKVNDPIGGVAYEEYCVEGVLLEPKVWISWDIVAEEFYFDDLKK